MATEKKLNKDGSVIKVRRLYWGERKKIKNDGGEVDFEEMLSKVLELVVEPKEKIDDLDMKEVQDIFAYAMGHIDELEEKN